MCWNCKRVAIDDDSGIIKNFSIFPDLCPFAAIGANINILAALENLAAEFHILFVVPDFFKRLAFQIAERMLCILIETAGDDQSVPGDHRCMPEAPAMILKGILKGRCSIVVLPVPAVFAIDRDQSVGIMLIVVDLRRLETDLVYSDLSGESPDIFQLVFVGTDYEELEKDKWGLALQLLFPFDDIAGAFQHFLQLTAYAVLLVYLLGGAIDRNNQAVESTFHGLSCVMVIEVMCIRGGSRIDTFPRGVSDHIEEGGVEIGFSLEIKNEVQQVFGELIDGIAEKIVAQHPGGPGEGPEAAGAFGAAKITGGGRFEGDGDGVAPLNGFFCPFAQVIAAQYLHTIPQAPPCELG